MNLFVTVSRWLLDHRAHHAALFLTKCRIRREREARDKALKVARQIRVECGLPPLEVLG